ncbi:MAG: DNA repair protein RecN [Victivallales bacterium]
MLKWLHIKNLALVDEADIEFSPGFNAVTGETGAGKSVLMGGVALLLGGRFDKSAIRQGTDRCEIAGEFRLDSVSEPQIAAILEECGLEPCEDSTLLVRRVFTPSGGRIFINSSPANAQLLRTIGELLVDVHSPNEAFGLMKNSAQLKALDRFAHLEPLLEQTAAAWASIREIEAEQEEFQKTMPDADEAEHLRKTVSEIEKQSPEDGEDAQLEALHSAASNSKTILEIAAAASAALNESDDSIMDRLSSVRRLLRPLENVDPDYADRFLSKCDEISDAVSELTDDLQSRASSVELDESEFAALEERIQILQTLKRKYGPEIPDVLAYLENARRRLDLFENSAREREQLESRMTQAKDTHAGLCEKLTAARKSAAENLAEKLRREIMKLGFKRAAFQVEFSGAQPGPNGADRIEFLFSANPGVPVKPLKEVASSGELSRVMLAVKTVLAEVDEIGTLVFDEIDANIGGETAVVVAGELHELGTRKQVLCISHLAQVAARADRHFAVEKKTTEEAAVSSIRVLTQKARIAELGRMLGGGAAAERHAKSLLD